MAKLKKDKETWCVIMNKQGSVVKNKSCIMFICSFRKRLTLRRLIESKGK